MAHVHQHGEDRSAYYYDQLFMIGICGALAGVTIMLWASGVLERMLHPKFGIVGLLGAGALLLLVVLRAIAVWRSVDETAVAAHDHAHGHGHAHGHEHGPECGHSHGTETGVQTLPLPVVTPPGPTHSHGDGHDHGWAPWRYVVLLLPVALYFLVLSNPEFEREMVDAPTTAMDRILNFIKIFRSIVWEALPFIVLGSIIAGLLEELLPQRLVAALLPRSKVLAILIGGLLGLIFPMCECGIVPVMRRLLRKGFPLSCCVAYLLAGPIINVVVLMSTYVAFSGMENAFEGGKPSYQMGGWWMVGFRAGLGYLVAVLTALCVEWQYRRHGDALLTPLARPRGGEPEPENGAERRTLWERVNNISETALHDFVDITVFLILGALLAATTRQFFTTEDIGKLNIVLAILLMMGLAIVLCLCSEADAFVAASFITMRPAAKLAFLVLGPMLDFKLYLMYTRVFRPRLIWTIYTAVVLQVFVYSYAVHVVWDGIRIRLGDREIQLGGYARNWIDPVKAHSGVSATEAPMNAARIIGVLAAPPQAGRWLALGTLAAQYCTDDVVPISFLQLESAKLNPDMRAFYEGKRVRLTGRYYPLQPGRSFTLMRWRINCCEADATPLRVPIVLPESARVTLPDKDLRNKWVQVTGVVKFAQDPMTGTYSTVVELHPSKRTPLDELVQVIDTPANPYVY
jgi:uncharacterized membrane protein YraQ (UPF0718 family)